MSAAGRRGLIVAAIHVAIVASLGGKLLFDRAHLPRAWAKTAPVDPDLPIRGRYVRLAIEAPLGPSLAPDAAGMVEPEDGGRPTRAVRVELVERDGRVLAERAPEGRGRPARILPSGGRHVARLTEALAFFIPEDVADPSRREPGEQLWVEVTLPRAGPPRPIRLGVMSDGELRPLDLRVR